jgi:hypothetical protein
MAFFGLEYWKRRWIIQEIAAASRVQVMCGNERIALHEMNTAISRCQASCYWLQEVESSYYYLEKVLDFRKQYQENQKPLLSHAIKKSRKSLSADARDKIFALLGICDDGTELVPEKLGYQYPAEVIVSNITKALIQKTGCLDLILINSIYKTTRNLGALPTWTPDWLSHDIPDAAHQLAERPRGMQQVLPPADLPIDSGMLRVQGVSIGKILDITSTAQFEIMYRNPSECADRPSSSVASAPPYYCDSHDTCMALIRCLTGNIPTESDSESTATVVYALHAALGTEGFGFERNLDKTDERLTRTTQKAVGTWVHTHSAFSIQEKSLKEWLETGIAFRFWIGICNSNIALALIFVSLLVLVLAIDYSMFHFLKFIQTSEEHGLSQDGREALTIIFCVFWLPVIPLGPLVSFLVVQDLAGTANFVAVTIPHFEMGLADFASSSRRILVSDQGFLGTTHVAAEPGDEISLLVGCSSAVILRKKEGDTGGGDDMPPRYQVVGKVNVHLSLEDQDKYKRVQYGDNEYRVYSLLAEYREQGLLQDFDLI